MGGLSDHIWNEVYLNVPEKATAGSVRESEWVHAGSSSATFDRSSHYIHEWYWDDVHDIKIDVESEPVSFFPDYHLEMSDLKTCEYGVGESCEETYYGANETAPNDGALNERVGGEDWSDWTFDLTFQNLTYDEVRDFGVSIFDDRGLNLEFETFPHTDILESCEGSNESDEEGEDAVFRVRDEPSSGRRIVLRLEYDTSDGETLTKYVPIDVAVTN